MLNSEKNAFLDAVKASGIELGMLRFETVASKNFRITNQFQPEGLKVQLAGSELWFVVFKAKFGTSKSWFACKATQYNYIEERYSEEGWKTFGSGTKTFDDAGFVVFTAPLAEVTKALEIWIKDNIPNYIQEKSIPDLWQMAAAGSAITSLAGVEDTPFSPSEREQLQQGVEKLREFIEVTFEANEQQRRLIAQKLDVLSATLVHLGRASWFTFALGTLATIGSTLYLNNEQGRALLQYARDVFEGAVKYLQ